MILITGGAGYIGSHTVINFLNAGYEIVIFDNLENGHLGGAALDVFQTEPLPPNNRLWKTKNLIITPHVAGNLTLAHTRNKNVSMFLEDLKNFTEGASLKYLVNRKLGY